ncbi:hypothetical protein Dvina_10755 [Dactylosporangium vinaceum]|uniref:Uncharacterized protein n=1 Tax=Dactylosporangium vinaceum TaxID=53362 RepID=A0ABV5MBQ9_9ACTN|nr:hypothetical protein [Dactylosporangium vinaceum]UAB98519.1 hypothetical protein Dvina_10755 [Dactylosporangium vinaceum]
MTNLTRRSLHGLAELVLAGPQYRSSGTIRLGVGGGGFRTVAAPELTVTADALVRGDGHRVDLAGRTLGEVAAAAGVAIGAPENLYPDGSGAAAEDVVVLDGAAQILEAFAAGDAALRALSGDVEPVLWPEHFDLGISLDEVNYGVSAGDSTIDEPYAYVGPWKARTGDFWNVSFGAAHPVRALPDLLAFFEEGRRTAAS